MEDDTLIFTDGGTAPVPPVPPAPVLSDRRWVKDDAELDFAAADSSEPIGETVTFTVTIYPTDPTTNDISPWTVTHDRGGELI